MSSINKETPISSIIKCKHCGKEKARYRSSLFPNGKDYKFVDENGRLFNGHVCPDCVREKSKLRERNKATLLKMVKELESSEQ